MENKLIFKDNRGILLFPIKNLNFSFKECTVSINKKDVFRGVHVNNFEKLVTCIQGKIIDIVVNIETEEVTYYNLSPGDQVLIPKNYGHAFLSLEEDSILLYHFNGVFDTTKFYHYSKFKIELKENIIISEQDNIKN